jgi:hypothetical protein
MGGSWERLKGIARRIIDSILYDARHKRLSHEVLCTFMAETTAIMNSRPLVAISSDCDSPCVLSPNALLTTKTTFVVIVKSVNIHDANEAKIAQLELERISIVRYIHHEC